MAHVSAQPPVFTRGSTVLDYWLVHAEGLKVQPLGARVEEVVVGAPAGHAEALIVRSRVTRRRKSIPAESIAAVEPSAGELLLERTGRRSGLRVPHPSRERLVAVGAGAQRGGRATGAHLTTAGRATRAGTVAAAVWLRPRAVRTGKTTARYTRIAATHTAAGASWLAPRLAAGARITAVVAARVTLTVAAMIAQSGARAAQELERGATAASERGRASIAARRARE